MTQALIAETQQQHLSDITYTIHPNLPSLFMGVIVGVIVGFLVSLFIINLELK